MFIARLTDVDGQPVYVNLDEVRSFHDSGDRNRGGTLLYFASGVTEYVAEPAEQVAGLIPGGVARPERRDGK